MKIQAALTFDKIRHDQETDAHLVISLTAPTKDGEARAPICVVPVIDVSGSMSGAKLEYAKRSALKLIDHLRPGDYTGLIAFESSVHVIIKPQLLTAETKEKLKAEVGKLHTMGGTNFSGGMLKAIDLVNKLDLPDGVLHRIIMLTDGQPNEGQAKSPADIIRVLGANAGRVTASAFGFGTDVDQAFLGDFAREGKGNYAFIQDPDGALQAFGKELGGLLSTYATDLQIEVEGLAGHEITSVVSDVDADQEDIGGEVTIKLPEILAEERRDLTLAVKMKETKQAFPRAVNVFDLTLSYDIIAPDGKKERKTEEVKAKVQFVKAGEEDKKPIAELDKIVALAEIVRAQIEAEEKVKAGDYKGASAQMDSMAVNLGGRGHGLLRSAALQASGSVGSHGNYVASAGYLRSFREGGTRGMGAASYDAGAQAVLADAGVCFTNSVQTSTSSSFQGDAVVADVAPLMGQVAPSIVADLGVVLPTSALGHAGHPSVAGLGQFGGFDPSGGLGQMHTVTADVSSMGGSSMWVGGHDGGARASLGVVPNVHHQHNPILVAPPSVPQASSADPDSPKKAAKKSAKKSKSTRW